MPTLDATVAGATANTYQLADAVGAVADADPWFAALWAAVTDPDARARALLAATARLDLVPWVGARSTTTQALAWPRTPVLNHETGVPFPADALPAWLLRAHAWLALDVLRLAQAATDPRVRTDADALRRVTAGPVSVEYRDDPAYGATIARVQLPPLVAQLIAPYVAPSAGHGPGAAVGIASRGAT